MPWNFPASQRDDYEIHLIEKGRARYYIGDKGFDVKPGSVVLLSCVEGNHCVPCDADFRIIFITFRFKNLNNINNANELERIFKANNYSIELDSYEKIQDIFHKMSMVKSLQLPKFKFELKTLFSMLVLELYIKELAQETCEKKQVEIHKGARSKVDKIIIYIYNNYKQKLTLNELAKETGLHPRYICSIFKDITGVTVNTFLKNIRIEKAKKLLINTHLSITEISYDIGFGSSQYFSRVFKEVVGCMASEYRNKANR